MSGRRAAAIGAALLAAQAVPAAGQQVRTALMPDSVTIGSVVRAAVRVDLPAGWRLALADTLPVADTLENAGPRTVQQRTLADGGIEVTAVYTLTPWRTGDLAIPPVPVRVVGPNVDRLLEARFVSLHVQSVLPADTGKQQPKPPHDVVGADRLLWPYIMAGLLGLLLLALLLYWLVRRLRRRRPVAVEAEVLTPRERALRELDRARAAGLLETGEVKTFYSRCTDAVRQYLDGLDPRWGADRTTSELIPRLRLVDLRVAAGLARLLDRADLVKFAQLRPAQPEAMSDWSALRQWVESFPEPQPVGEEPVGGEEVRAA